jgi:hypothetical protein
MRVESDHMAEEIKRHSIVGEEIGKDRRGEETIHQEKGTKELTCSHVN